MSAAGAAQVKEFAVSEEINAVKWEALIKVSEQPYGVLENYSSFRIGWEKYQYGIQLEILEEV